MHYLHIKRVIKYFIRMEPQTPRKQTGIYRDRETHNFDFDLPVKGFRAVACWIGKDFPSAVLRVDLIWIRIRLS